MKHLLGRVAHKASQPLFNLLRIDRLTSERIYPSDDLVHVGSTYGGWKIPVGRLRPNALCYCVGCGEDISFDLALVREFSCQVYAFDPTPRAIAHVAQHAAAEPDYHFLDVGLWSHDDTLRFYAPRDATHVSHSLLNLQQTTEYFEAKVERLSTVMRRNSHRRIDLLKLDIEGAEYAVIDSLLEDRIDIDILCVEYDEYGNPLDRDYKRRITDSIAKLIAAGFVLVCAEGNGNYTFVQAGTRRA